MLDLGEDRLDAFATLFVCRLADVIAAGFEVVATYRSPHVTIRPSVDVSRSGARSDDGRARSVDRRRGWFSYCDR